MSQQLAKLSMRALRNLNCNFNEKFGVALLVHKGDTRSGMVCIDFDGTTESTILTFKDGKINLNKLYCWNTWNDVSSLLSTVQYVLDTLHYSFKYFCQFNISTLANLDEHLISPLSAEQRRDVHLTKSTASGETPLHRAIIKGDSECVTLIFVSLENKTQYHHEIIAATNNMFENSLHTALIHGRLHIFRTIYSFLPDDAMLEVLMEAEKKHSRTVFETAISLYTNCKELIVSILDSLEPYEQYQVIKHKNKQGNFTLKIDNGQRIFEIILKELSTEDQLELLEIPDSCGASTVDLARRAKKDGALRETSSWVLERYSWLQTELILSEEDLESKSICIRRAVQQIIVLQQSKCLVDELIVIDLLCVCSIQL